MTGKRVGKWWLWLLLNIDSWYLSLNRQHVWIMTIESTLFSSFLCCVHFWHLLCFALAEWDVTFCCCLVEFTAANMAWDHTICLIWCCLLFSCQLLTFSLFDSCSESCTLKLPFWYFFFFRFCCCFVVFCFLLLYGCRKRRGSFEVLSVRLSVSSWIESFSFWLKDFLTYFFMFCYNLSTKLSSASFWTLN